jgi:hypothetical protein
MDVQQTVLNLIEKQPVVSPDMLEAIAAPAPTMTPEQNSERIEKLKNRVRAPPQPQHYLQPLHLSHLFLHPLPSPPLPRLAPTSNRQTTPHRAPPMCPRRNMG